MSSSTKSQNLPNGYKLLDSGDGRKFEQFGQLKLIRPASTAIWRPRKKNWQADSEYIPKQGWNKNVSGSHKIKCINDIELDINLQNNGQIGIFPEHQSYLSDLSPVANSRALNLFAYTGLATCYLASQGMDVTHVDISKKCLDWANDNIQHNQLGKNVRLIKEDSLAFLSKEAKRGNKYDLIILDPPSFSRVSKNKTWDLEKVLPEFIETLAKVVNANFTICFSSHLHQGFNEIVGNLFLDQLGDDIAIESRSLTISEANSARKLPASNLIKIQV